MYGCLHFPCMHAICGVIWAMTADTEDANNRLRRTLHEKVQQGVANAMADLRTLAKHPVYVLNVAGTAVYTGTHSLGLLKWLGLHMP